MLTLSEEDYIKNYAYIPEHITGYVTTISKGEPFLFKNYLCYYVNGYLIFVGYPLKESFEERETKNNLVTAIERFKPEHIAVIAPVALMPQNTCSKSESDKYYKLDLSNLHIHQKLRNMISHASRELYIEKGQEFKAEHKLLISEFLNTHKVDTDIQYIFERIPAYISSVPTALVFSARDKRGKLIAFDVAEFGSKDYTFYMFNFLSQHHRIRGASDFLLYEVIKSAKKQGKKFINLGLGVNKGIMFFKKKWGGIPFLDYEYCIYPVRKNVLPFRWVKI